ncbi:MAG: hypothetical protein ACOCPN_01400 [Desulfonatronovibrionaceae bacterium]
MPARRLLLACMLAALLFGGCAPRQMVPPRSAPDVWHRFQARNQPFPEHQPFLISASIVYVHSDRTSRVKSSLWGRLSYPIRMDLRAGFGQTVAMWYEDQKLWEAYFPDRNIKFVHHDGSQGAAMLGYPTPFDLNMTSRVLLADFQGIIPSRFDAYQKKQEFWEFRFEQGMTRKAMLDMQGRLVSASGPGWSVKLEGYENQEGIGYYSRIEFRLGNRDKAVVRIKSVSIPESDWSTRQLTLEIPEESKEVYLPGL